MPASTLIEQVSELIAKGRELLPQTLQDQLRELETRLREPVRVAVVGRVNAGKSTMVNALLGQHVAPTDVSECTKLVTWFHYGHPQRVEVELMDGARNEIQLSASGTLPDEVGVPVDQVRALHCFLANDILRWMTLIDTPGIGSVHGEISGITEELLSLERDSADAARRADAVVFLLNQVMMEDELQALQMFRKSAGGDSETSAANAVGVLSKADQLGDGSRDPWHVAVELAGVFAGKFRDEVATVVPVVGLIAESSETAAIGEADTRAIGQLASMDQKAFERLLWSADRFVSAEAPVPEVDRERLLTLLDLYGIQRAVASVRGGVAGAVALRRALSDSSGIAEVKRTLATYFHEQDHVLKVRSAFELLKRMTYADAAEDATPAMVIFRGMVERLRLDPDMHAVDELQAWHDCCNGRIELPEGELIEVERLFAPGTPARKLAMPGADHPTLVEAAKQGMLRWRSFMVTQATPEQARLARVVLRSYQLLWTSLNEEAS